jgi:hypothetical protein
MANRKAELDGIIRNARAELDEIVEKERRVKGQALVGKCYRYRNSYSCPQKESDYWWLYMIVLGVTDGALICFKFQRDSEQKIEIEPDTRVPLSIEGELSDSYEEIERGLFSVAWEGVLASINKVHF